MQSVVTGVAVQGVGVIAAKQLVSGRVVASATGRVPEKLIKASVAVERVGARFTFEQVVAGAAVKYVVAVATAKLIGATLPKQLIGARVAIEQVCRIVVTGAAL